jgi:hypothetical protein
MIMATKTIANDRRSAETEQNRLPAQAREQMADLTESAANLYKGAEAVQQVHQHAAQRFALRLQQAADQLRSSDNPGQLLSVQSTLMLGGVQEWAQYVQEMTLTMMRLQVQLMHRAESAQPADSAGADGEVTSTRSMNAATAAADVTNAATLAVLKSWSNMMGGGMGSSVGNGGVSTTH